MIKVAETERLILRELNISDSEQFYLLNSDPEVLKFTGDQPFLSVSESETFLKNYSDYEKNGFGRWAVITKESNKFIGWCGLKLNEEKLIDLGFRFFRNEWGKGYATESAKVCLEFGFTNLQIEEIIGRAALENKASIRVLEKLGMRFWKNDSSLGLGDSVYYSMNQAQFYAGKSKQLQL